MSKTYSGAGNFAQNAPTHPMPSMSFPVAVEKMINGRLILPGRTARAALGCR
jgi:hypothetical protein